MQSTLTTKETLYAAFKEAGYACKSFGGLRDFAGAPVSTGKDSADCYAFSTSNGRKSVCYPNAYKAHSALCSCKIPEGEL